MQNSDLKRNNFNQFWLSQYSLLFFEIHVEKYTAFMRAQRISSEYSPIAGKNRYGQALANSKDHKMRVLILVENNLHESEYCFHCFFQKHNARNSMKIQCPIPQSFYFH